MTGTSDVFGDFNINVMENTPTTNEYLSLIERHGFFICDTTNNTRPASNSNLDHVFTNNIMHDIQLNTFSYNKFDHKLMFIEINNETVRENGNRYTHKRIDYEKLDSAIRNDEAFSTNNQHINTYNQFISTLQSHVIACSSTSKPKKPQRNAKPYVDQELIGCIATRDILFEKLQADENNDKIKRELKYWQNKLLQ